MHVGLQANNLSSIKFHILIFPPSTEVFEMYSAFYFICCIYEHTLSLNSAFSAFPISLDELFQHTQKISCNTQGEGSRKISETPTSLQYMIPIKIISLLLCTCPTSIFPTHIYGSQILLFIYATSLLCVLDVKSLKQAR